MEQLNYLTFMLFNFLIRVGYLHRHYNSSEGGGGEGGGGGNLLLLKKYTENIYFQIAVETKNHVKVEF